MASKSNNTAVAKQDQSANALIDPELMKQIEADSGLGVSDRAEDRIQAWVKVLHQLSPEMNPRDPDFVKDAKPGDIWIKAQNLLVPGDKGIIFQQCAYQLRWVEWPGAVGSSGQPVARYDKAPPNWEFGGIVTDDGHHIIETRYHLGIVYADGLDPFPAQIAFSSTGAPVSINWSNIQKHKKLPNGKMAPAYLSLYRLTTIERSNEKGRWFLLDPKDAGHASSDQIRLGMEVSHDISEQKLKMGEGESGDRQYASEEMPL
jgi:hypothetical protein